MSSSMCKDIPERVVSEAKTVRSGISVSYLHQLAMLVLCKCVVSLMLEKDLEAQFYLYCSLTESKSLVRKR